MALTIGIDFEASIARLEENTRKAAGSVQQMASQIDGAADFARTALIGLAGAFSATAFASAVRSAIDLADSLDDLSKRTGASVEMLAGLRWAAQLSDTSLEGVANGVRKLAVNMVENRGAFEALGISTTDQTEALIQLGDVFAGMPDPVQRAALAAKVFGDRVGTEMLPLLLEGSAGIRRMVEQGQQFAGISADMAAQSGHFNDQLDLLRLKGEGVALGIAGELLPRLNATLEAFNELTSSGNGLVGVGQGIATVFETVVVLGANVGFVFGSIGREIGGIAAQLAALAQGDFEGFKRIGEEMKADAIAARKEVDAFSERMLNPPAAPVKDDAKGSGGGNTRGSQLLASLSKTVDEAQKLRDAQLKSDAAYLEAMWSQVEAREEIQRAAALAERQRSEESELAWQQGVAQRLMTLQMAGMTEAEIERGKLTQIQTDLQFARDQGWLTEVSYHEMLEQAQLEHEARMGNIVAQGALARQKFMQMSARQQTQTVLQEMLNLTNGVATTNRTLFEINKVAGIANAVINTYTGVSRTLSAYPYPWNLPMAALHLASGLAQIQSIKSAQFGTSTSAPSIGGGAATPVTNADPGGASGIPLSQAPAATTTSQQVSLTFNGSGRYTYQEVVDGIAPLLKEAAGNGALDVSVGFA